MPAPARSGSEQNLVRHHGHWQWMTIFHRPPVSKRYTGPQYLLASGALAVTLTITASGMSKNPATCDAVVGWINLKKTRWHST